MNLYYSFLKLKARILQGRKVSSYEIAQEISLRRRPSLKATRMIGITGSGAKTTTSAFLYHLLSGSAPTALSFLENTLDRIAMRLARFPRRARFGVFEISGHAPGVMRAACAVVQPDVAIVTLVASDHRSNFVDAQEIAREKGILVEEAAARGGFALLNADDPLVCAMRERAAGRALTYGEAPGADYRAVDVSHSPEGRLLFTCAHGEERVRFDIGLLGRHFLVSALSGIACAHRLGVPLAQLAERARSYAQFPGRCSLHPTLNGPTFICDSIKAPFATLGLSFALLQHFPAAPRRTLVLGQIADYSGAQGDRYRQVYRAARQYADRVIILGHGNLNIKALPDDNPGESLQRVSGIVQLRELIASTRLPGEVILLKGSYKIDRMERILLDYEGQVDCWIDGCRKIVSCFECESLSKAGNPRQRPRGLIEDPDYFVAPIQAAALHIDGVQATARADA